MEHDFYGNERLESIYSENCWIKILVDNGYHLLDAEDGELLIAPADDCAYIIARVRFKDKTVALVCNDKVEAKKFELNVTSHLVITGKKGGEIVSWFETPGNIQEFRKDNTAVYKRIEKWYRKLDDVAGIEFLSPHSFVTMLDKYGDELAE